MMNDSENAVVKLVFEEKDTGEKKKGIAWVKGESDMGRVRIRWGKVWVMLWVR